MRELTTARAPAPPDAHAGRLRAKRRLLFAWLALLAAWPVAQHLLVQQYGLNPWKFFGFAMYCTPQPEPMLNLWTLDGQRPLSLPVLLAGAPNGAGAVREFTDLRRLWGRLYGPDRLAAEVFAAKPDLPGFVLYINTVRLDRHTSMPTHDTDTFECRAGGVTPCIRVTASH